MLFHIDLTVVACGKIPDMVLFELALANVVRLASGKKTWLACSVGWWLMADADLF
jgi:hypothetical protein